LDDHVDARARYADFVARGATGVDDLAAGVIDDLLAFKGIAFLDHLGLIDQDDTLVAGEVLDGQAIGLDDVLVGGRLLLVVGRFAHRGEDIDIAAGRLGDGHGIASDLQGALSDDHVATIDGHALPVVQLGAVGLDANRLIAIRWQCPGSRASQCGAEAENQGEGIYESHYVLLRWTSGTY